jgi:serpin B
VEHEIALHVANAPFAQRGFSLHQAFLDDAAARFGAGLRPVDFIRDSEGARQAINGWVKEQTRERIPELLADPLDSTTLLVLVNAVYLNAPWPAPWSRAGSGPLAFTRSDGTIVHVPMLITDGRLPYGDGDGWQAVDLPYLGGELAMLLIVPDDLASFGAELDGDRLSAIVGALGERQALVTMPKFEIETSADLIPALDSLGMHAAFGDADFSGISDEPLFVGAVVHQANISVDEKGTEAAAATAVSMAVSAPYGDVEVHANRPFMFAVRDRQTGAILFLGHVADPSAAA